MSCSLRNVKKKKNIPADYKLVIKLTLKPCHAIILLDHDQEIASLPNQNLINFLL